MTEVHSDQLFIIKRNCVDVVVVGIVSQIPKTIYANRDDSTGLTVITVIWICRIWNINTNLVTWIELGHNQAPQRHW